MYPKRVAKWSVLLLIVALLAGMLASLTAASAAEGERSETTLSALAQAEPQSAPGTMVYVRSDPVPDRYYVPPSADLRQQPRQTMIIVDYLAAGQKDAQGRTCESWPVAAQDAYAFAVDIWEAQVESSVPIVIEACYANLADPDLLGYGGSWDLHGNFDNAPTLNTFYPVSLANALAESDLNEGDPEIVNTFNSQISWYFGTDGNTPTNRTDFVTVVLHETGHGLGFSGSMRWDDAVVDEKSGNIEECNGNKGWGCWGWEPGEQTVVLPEAYDRFAEDADSRRLIDTAAYTNPSQALGNALTSGGIFFNGPHANRANGGGRVKLYAPAAWKSGSSFSHLDYDTYHRTGNALMIYAIADGSAIHDPGPVTRGILLDMGWYQAPILVNDRYDVEVNKTLSVAAPGVLANDMAVYGRPSVYLMMRFLDGSHRICQVSGNADSSWDWTGTATHCDNCSGQACPGTFTVASTKGRPASYYVRYLGYIQQWRIVEYFAGIGRRKDIMDGTAAAPIAADSPLAATTFNGEPRIYYLSANGRRVQELAWYSGQWHYRDVAAAAGAPPAAAGSVLVATSITNGDPRVYYLATVNGALHVQELAYLSIGRVWYHRDLTAETGAPAVATGSPLAATTSNLEPRLFYLSDGPHIYALGWSNGAWSWQRLDPDDAGAAPDAGRLAAITVNNEARVYFTHANVIQELAEGEGGWVWSKVGQQASADDVISSSITATNVNENAHVYYTAADEVKPATAPYPSQNIHELAQVGNAWRHRDITSAVYAEGWYLDANAVSSVNAVTANAPALTASLVFGVIHGELQFQPDGSFNYKPPTGFFGQELFVYTAAARTFLVELNVSDPCWTLDDNLIQNFCFANGLEKWQFFQEGGQASYTLSNDNPFVGAYSAQIAIETRGRNMQFYQSGIHLQPNTTYRLQFAARSSDGQDMSVWLHQHKRPYLTYGLGGREGRVDLVPYWRWYSITFTTPDRADMSNARLRFWFKPYAHNGTVYHLDKVMLRPVSP